MSWDEFVECYNKGHEFYGEIDGGDFNVINDGETSLLIFKNFTMYLTDYNAKHFVLYQGKTLYELFENSMVELIEMF